MCVCFGCFILLWAFEGGDYQVLKFCFSFDIYRFYVSIYAFLCICLVAFLLFKQATFLTPQHHLLEEMCFVFKILNGNPFFYFFSCLGLIFNYKTSMSIRQLLIYSFLGILSVHPLFLSTIVHFYTIQALLLLFFFLFLNQICKIVQIVFGPNGVFFFSFNFFLIFIFFFLINLRFCLYIYILNSYALWTILLYFCVSLYIFIKFGVIL